MTRNHQRPTRLGQDEREFPGLGDAVASTDTQPVAISQTGQALVDDTAAYRRCGHGPLALVMVSSASYPSLTGATPAVLSREIYSSVMPQENIDAVMISDDLDAGALTGVASPAMHALNAGLDLLLYGNPGSEAVYGALAADMARGALSRSRVEDAAARVMALKQTLGLTR